MGIFYHNNNSPYLPYLKISTAINFRDGPNQVFQDAVAEMLSLAGSTPKYLHSLGLISGQEFKEDGKEADMNFLMNQVCQIFLGYKRLFHELCFDPLCF